MKKRRSPRKNPVAVAATAAAGAMRDAITATHDATKEKFGINTEKSSNIPENTRGKPEAPLPVTSAGSPEDDGWITVSRKQKKETVKKTGTAAQVPDSFKVPKKLRNFWFRSGACLRCGSCNHKIRDCVLSRPGYDNQSESRRKQQAPDKSYLEAAAPAATPVTGRKRKRLSRTGETPEEKIQKVSQGQKRKFDYAVVDKDAITLCIIRKNLEHVKRAEFDEVVTLLNTEMLNMALEGSPAPIILGSVYNTSFAAFAVKDKKAEKFLKTQVPISTQGKLLCLRYEELTQARKPAITLTGHVQGATADMEKTKLGKFIDVMRKQQGIGGDLKVVGLNKAKYGAILVLQVDETALQDLQKNGMLINVGCAGNILLTSRKQKDARSTAEEAPPGVD